MDFKRLEAGLRTLVESQILRALPGQKPEDRVAQRLIEAMEAATQVDEEGNRTAPNVYTLVVPPDSVQYWHDPQLLESIAEILNEAAAEAGSRFSAPPSIALSPDAGIGPGAFRVVASHEVAAMGQTQDVAANTPAAVFGEEVSGIPKNAFLIVDGVHQYDLNRPVINIGRRLDNDLVIEDPRVSRHHAQMRAIRGRYVLFDLNSSGGTYVNGQRKSQSSLQPGDVVTLGGVSLIYSQDLATPGEATNQTGPRPPADEERQRPPASAKHAMDDSGR